MTVALDVVAPSSSGQSYAGSTTTSWTHTVGAGSNMGLLVAIAVSGTTTGATTTVTYNGTSMASLGKRSSNDQTAGYLEVFWLAGVTAGGASVVVTISGGSVDGLEGGSISFSGADQSATPATVMSVGSSSTSTVANPSAALSAASGNYGVAAVACGQALTSPTQTLAWTTNRSFASAGSNGGAQYAAGTGGSLTYGWTATADWWAAATVEIPVVASTAWTVTTTDQAGTVDDAPIVKRAGDSLTWTVNII